jgi:H-type lectin domain
MRTGTFNFSKTTNPTNWNLYSGTGDRTFRATIKFPEPFETAPKIAVALTGLDASNAANTRVWIAAEDVENHEFDVVVNTWSDTLLYGINGVWIAE